MNLVFRKNRSPDVKPRVELTVQMKMKPAGLEGQLHTWLQTGGERQSVSEPRSATGWPHRLHLIGALVIFQAALLR